MRKALTYSSFATASLIVVLAFLTAKTYTQLGIAVALYPLLAYFAFKIFPLNNTVHLNKPKVVKQPAVEPPDEGTPVVVDIDRRAFLKLIGATGLSIFIFSILGRRVETLLFGRSQVSGPGLIGSPTDYVSGSGDASPTDGYRIAEIDDGVDTYYGFTNKSGGWLIMKEDSTSNSFRYAKGDFDFASNWASRSNLKYDYFYNLF